MADWLIAIDDGLVGRGQRCLLCGVAESPYWNLLDLGPLDLAYTLCHACHLRERAEVRAFLDARYREVLCA
jgi:hypothetical protein